RQESQARTRARLVQTAERIFLRQGFHSASIGQIARAAGYTTGAVYSNFASKEELCLAVLEGRVLGLADRLREDFAAAEPTVDARLAVLERWWETLLGDEEWAQLGAEFVLATRGTPAIRRQIAERLQVARTLVVGLLAAQQEVVGFDSPMDPNRLAAAVTGLGIGLSVQRIADPSLPAETFTETVRTLLRGAAVPAAS
ncbi:MAG: TetR/AcrR family transcriptional regulator, partial [Acidimicrobiales bacterium]